MHHQPPINAYIFDMVGVLFSLNKKLGINHIGLRAALVYCLRNKSNPFDDGMQLLNKMRLEAPGEFQDTFNFKGHLLPLSMALWQKGIISSHEVMKRILQFFDTLDKQHYFLHAQDKSTIVRMLQIMIDPVLSNSLLAPIPSSIALLEKLHAAKVPLFMLSNISTDIYNGLLEKYPTIFSLFTDIATSCNTHLLKPDPAIFTQLMTKNNLKPETTCFIDDQVENIAAAEELGLRTILCTNPENLPHQLEALSSANR